MPPQQQLEQRVKSLEYEIKILKNEVQRTLLDIQEQILIHYYPSLRSEESGPPEGTIQSLESIRGKKQKLAGPTIPTKAAPAAPVAIQQVSLEDVQATIVGAPIIPGGVPVAQDNGADDQARVAALSGWVTTTVQKIGGERTSRLIQTCSAKGIISSDIETPLIRLTGLITAENVPDHVAVNEILTALLQMNQLLGREGGVEEALSIVEEANLG